jgi:hypothetical protein
MVQDSMNQLQMESGMTIDLIKSQLMMENTATAGFNTKGDEMMIPFEEDENLGGSRLVVRDGQGVVDANLSPWDHK